MTYADAGRTRVEMRWDEMGGEGCGDAEMRLEGRERKGCLRLWKEGVNEGKAVN